MFSQFSAKVWRFSYISFFVLASFTSVIGQQMPSLQSSEVQPHDVDPGFQNTWQYRRDSIRGSMLDSSQKHIRVVYLVPSDKTIRSDYRTNIANAFVDLREFYRGQLGDGYSFLLASPVVDIYQTSHTSSYYSSNQSRPTAPQYIWFWENALADGFTLTGGSFNDPNNRWVFYIDADTACGQVIGGNAGVALMASNDLRGLSGEQNVPSCAGDPPDNFGLGRWIGGAGHELGHTFNIPHPPGCGGSGPNYGCSGGAFAANSLMWVGYASYPNTYFLPEDKQILFASGFLYNSVSIVGRVFRPGGRGLANGRVRISTSGRPDRYAMTNPFGYFRFVDLTAGTNYTLQAEHKSFIFEPRQVTPVENLAGFDISAR